MNVPHRLKTFLDDVLLKAVGDIGEGLVVLEGTRVVYANETFQKMTGYSEEQLLNISSFFNLLEGSDKARQQEKIAAFRKNPRKPLRFESPLRNDAGKPMTAEITLTVLKDDPQDRMVGLVRDVTDQKRLMEAVKDQEVQYKLLFKNNPSPMFIYDLENLAILSVNDAAILKYGFTEKEFLSMSLRDLRRAEDIPQMLEQLEGLKRGGNVLKEEVLHRKKDGSLIEVEVISHSTLFEGRSARVMLAYDLTEHRKAENALRESERRLSAVVTNAPIILFTLDMDGKVALSEGSGLKSLRLKPGGLVGKSAFDLYKDNPAMISLLRRAIGGESVSGTVEIGGLFFETRCSPLAGDDGKPQGVLGMAIDVTETKRAEQALVDSERKFRELFNNANDAIFLYPLSDEAVPGKFLEVNDIACQKLGYSRSELLHMTPLDVVAPEGLGEMPKIYKRSLKQEHITYEKVHVTKSGMKIPVEVNAHTFLRNGQKAVLSIARDVTDRKRAEETIRRQAYYDVLTNLPNRMLFKDRLEQAMSHAHRNKQSLGVIVLDLDRFKNINETLGHILGDRLLVAVAERLIGSMQEGETIARFGGDEFTLLLPQVNQVDEATQHAQKVIEILAEPFKVNNHELHLTTSMGIAFYPDDGENAEVLLKNAETAMYRAKEQGRNNYQLYASVMNVSAFKQLLMENSLRRALEKEEFVVHYQPQIDLATRRVVGVEALVRWQHPDLGLVFPTEFIGLAEETGLIVPIGEWMIKKVCQQNKKWQDMGLPKVCISVNLSARQFQQRNLVTSISKTLSETGLDPQSVGFEITETIAMKNADFTISALNELQKMGIHLSLDDFGTGYSSLSYLKRFPLETLKIDRSFVRDIATDPNDAAIVTAVIALAHSLKLSVVAEGVETEAQIAFLTDHRCDQVQGYYFSHPLSEDQFFRMLKEMKSSSKP